MVRLFDWLSIDNSVDKCKSLNVDSKRILIDSSCRWVHLCDELMVLIHV